MDSDLHRKKAFHILQEEKPKREYISQRDYFSSF